MNSKILNTFAAAIAVLLTLLGSVSAHAGNIFVVPLPGTNTDIATGITTNKTYVSCFDYGNRNATIYSVNGVPFAHPDFLGGNNVFYLTNFVDPASGVWPSGGQVLGGSVFLSTITNSANTIGHIDQTSSAPPNTPGPQSDGNTLNLLYDQIYIGSGQTAGDWMQEVYSNLVAGDNYSLRIYWRVQTTANTNRLIDFWFNGEAAGPQAYSGNPVSLDTNVVTHFSGAEYIEYDFTAAGTTVTMLMTNIIGGQGSTTFFSTLENDSSNYAPFITYEPSTADLGNGIFQFSVQAIGTPALSYQWYTNSVDSYSGAVATADGGDYSGSLSNILTTTSLTPTNDLLNYYFLVVSSAYGYATSSIVQINPLPAILAQPSPTNMANSYVQYNAVASGFPPLTYQWYVSTNNGYTNGIATTDGNGYLGSLTTNLEATTNLQDYYFIVATDPFGSTTSSITAYNPLPTVTQPVVSEVANSIQLTVTASGWPTLAYQWYFNTSSNYSGASVSTDGNGVFGSTTSSLTITNASDYYFVVVTNYYGSVTSSIVAPAIQLVVTSAGEPIWNQTNQIVVSFSDIVDPVTSTTIANYALNNSASILSANLVGASNEVVLTTTPLSGSYTLTIQNVKDASFGVEMSPSLTNLTVGLYPANLALWVRANAANVTPDNLGYGGIFQWNDMSSNNNTLFSFDEPLGNGAPYDPILATNAWGDTVVRFGDTNATALYAVGSSLDITSGNMTVVAVVNFATLTGLSSGVGTNGEIVSCTGNNLGANLSIPAPYDYYVSAPDPAMFRGNGGSSGDGNSYGQYTAPNGPTAGVPHVLAVTESYNLVTHYLDGAVVGSGVLNGNFNVTNIAFGGNPTYVGWRADGVQELNGDLAELIVAGSTISAYDLSQLTSYLAQEHNISFINQTPTNIVYSVSNGNLTLSWPADQIGWQLQAQTNSLSVGLSTNWVNVSGSTTNDQVTIPISLTNGAVFYRLIYTP